MCFFISVPFPTFVIVTHIYQVESNRTHVNVFIPFFPLLRKNDTNGTIFDRIDAMSSPDRRKQLCTFAILKSEQRDRLFVNFHHLDHSIPNIHFAMGQSLRSLVLFHQFLGKGCLFCPLDFQCFWISVPIRMIK